MRRNIALIAMAGMVFLAGCGGASKKPVTSLLLITVDTLRADHVGCYGAKTPTPAMDSMAASGVRFARAYAHNVVALPSHANILSGLLPTAHGVRDNSGFRFPGNIDTAPTFMKARGFSCAAFVGGSPLDSRFGLNVGFDLYDDHFGDATQALEFQLVERRAEDVTTPFLKWLDAKQPGAKWFAWVHYYDPHAPYEPLEPYRSKFASSPYDGEIAAVDAQVARILEHLKQKGWSESTSVILTSDHGEGLGEHGEATHGVFAYENTLRVPLIITGPGVEARTVQETVQHIDLLPTMLDLAGAQMPTGLKGKSLKPLVYGAKEDSTVRDVYFESLGSNLNMNWAPLTGIVSGGQKYIDLPIPELYDVTKDPGERDNLSQKNAGAAGDLKKRVAALASATMEGKEKEELERLSSLGYISKGASNDSGPTVSYTADDDPKNLIGLGAMLDDGIAAARAGDLERARRVFSDIVAKRPTMSAVYGYLATVDRQMGQPKKGVDAIEGALKKGLSAPGLLANLGRCFSEAGQSQRAIEILEEVARGSDDTVTTLTYLGMAYEKAGQPDRAVESFEKIQIEDPKNSSGFTNVGRVCLAKKDNTRAVEALNRALEINPRFAPAHDLMGDALAADGKSEEAASSWKQAVQIDPAQYGALFKLATLYQKLGRAADAKPYAEQFVASAPAAKYKREIEQLRKMIG